MPFRYRHAAPLLLACVLSSAGRLGGAADAPEPDEQLLRDAGVGGEDAALLAFVRQRGGAVEDGRMKALVKQLASEDFDAREEASRQLAVLGERAAPYLEAARKDPDLEVSRRADDCLKRIRAGYTAELVGAAARVLAKRRPAGAAAALLAYAPAADAENAGDAVRDALAVLARGDDEPALVAALTDKEPARRVAAGHALAAVAGRRDAVRALLRDERTDVRWAVGLALLRARDRAAVPPLIALLDDAGLKRAERRRVEALLYRLAADKGPPLPPGDGDAVRRKYRAAWEAWWKEEGAGLAAERLEEAARPGVGNTLVLLLDRGVALDLDADDRPRLRFENLRFALDVQLLPDDHLLAAEHEANVVTERDRTGKVVWEFKIDDPLAAQRLDNGNTFIGTRDRVLEVDAAGKEVWSYAPRGSVMRARRLPDGRTAVVTQLGAARLVLLDKDRKEVGGFGIDVRTSGGRIDVLPNGNVLVPENFNNCVVEYDARGAEVWHVDVDQPISATRLPNGHTLITSMSLDVGAVEVDASGKQVWQYKTDTRVTRAMRR